MLTPGTDNTTGNSVVTPFPGNTDHADAPGQNTVTPAVFQVQGSMSTFGGPMDTGMSPSEGLALFDPQDLTDPRFEGLFLSDQPPDTTGLGRRLNPDKFYLACRWDYTVTSRSFLRNVLAFVQSVSTGQVEQASPVDWGPNTDTGRVADLSPGLAAALGLNTDDDVIITITGTSESFITPAAASTFNGPSGNSEPTVITTDQWGAAPASVSYFAQNPAAGIVIHNTQSANRDPLTGDAEMQAAAQLAQSIQNTHMVENHWADTGQHFTISRGGLILEGRHGSYEAARAGRVVQASHAISSDGSVNLTWFGIEMEGDNRQSDQVTAMQYTALVELCAWLMKWRGVQVLPIKGHQDILAGHTDCPGLFEQRIPALINDAGARRVQLG